MNGTVLTSSLLNCTVPAKSISAALALAQKVVDARNTIPLLANLLLEARRLPDGPGEIVITATNLDQSVTLRVPAEVASEGVTTAPAGVLADALRRAPKDATASFAIDGAELVVKYGRSRFRLPTLPASDFPTLGTPLAPVPQLGAALAHFEIRACTLTGMLEKVSAAISDEVTRFYLCGAYLHFNASADGQAGTLRVVATNGHVLGLKDEPAGAEGLEGAILPRRLVDMVHAVWGKDDLALKVSVDKSRIVIEAEGASLTSKLIDGTFPDYRRVIPAPGPSALRMEPGALSGAIERVMTVEAGKSRSVKLAVEQGDITLSARSAETGAATETLDAEPQALAEGFAIGFNARYALDALRALPGDTVEICLNSPGDPMLWRNPAEAGALWVVMPLRIG